MTNTTTTHAPINLATGLDLMVRADLADDPETMKLVEKCKELLDRAENIREIIGSATELAKAWDQADPDAELDYNISPLLEAAGIIFSRHETGAFELAVLLAVLPLLPDSRIIHVREEAELEARKLYAAKRAARS